MSGRLRYGEINISQINIFQGCQGDWDRVELLFPKYIFQECQGDWG